MKNKIIKFRIILWLALFLALVYFLYMGVVPFGVIYYSYDFENNSRFFKEIRPGERVEKINNGSQKIIGNPVYFSLYTPRKFDTAELTFEYKSNDLDETISKLIEVGVLVDKNAWRYNLEPLENMTIEQLSMVWDKIEGDGLTLLQQKKEFESINDFLENHPTLDKIAVYNYDLKAKYLINDYENSVSEKTEIALPLLGSWEFFTYIKDEELDFDLVFSDFKEQSTKDYLEVFVFFDKTLIYQKKFDASNDVKINDDNTLSLRVKDLPEGAYKIELKADKEVVTKKILTKQKKISFFNSLSLEENEEENIKLYTDSRIVQIKTSSPGGLQTLMLGEKELIVAETYKQYSGVPKKASSTSIYSVLKLEKDGITLSGNGVFSFNVESFFNPRIKSIDNSQDVLGEQIEFVLAKYKSPTEENSWKKQTITFDLKNVFKENQRYFFLISIPGLLADDDVDDYFEIGNIDIKLTGITIVDKLKKIIKKQ